MRIVLAWLIGAGAALVLAAAANAATLVGISDQSAATFRDPFFAPLAVGISRVVVPWNVVWTEPGRLARWADAAREAGIDPIVAFGHAAGDACPGSPCTLPAVAEYREAFLELRSRYPWIHTFTPWNEPNHRSQPTAGNPAAAARYYNALVDACPDCTITAGDVLDAPGFMDWLRAYRQALTSEPLVWALHNYYDTSYFQTTDVRSLIDAVRGEIWLTETGGIVTWRTTDGRAAMPYDEQRAAASVAFTFELAREFADRVSRLYLYQWRAATADDFDAGLERPDGTPRPSLDVVRSEIAPLWSAPPAGGGDGAPLRIATIGPRPGASADGAPLASARVIRRLVRMDRRGRLRVVVACKRAPCRGTLSVEGRDWAATTYVNGRLEPGTLAPRYRPLAAAAGARVAALFQLSRPVMRRARRHRALPITVGLVPSKPLEGWAERLRLRLRVAR